MPTKRLAELHWPSDEEEAAIQRGIAQDSDNPEWTEEDFANARPAEEAAPEIVAAWRAGKLGRPPIGDAAKAPISLRLSADVVAGLRALPGYNARVDAVLRAALAKGEL